MTTEQMFDKLTDENKALVMRRIEALIASQSADCAPTETTTA